MRYNGIWFDLSFQLLCEPLLLVFHGNYTHAHLFSRMYFVFQLCIILCWTLEQYSEQMR